MGPAATGIDWSGLRSNGVGTRFPRCPGLRQLRSLRLLGRLGLGASTCRRGDSGEEAGLPEAVECDSFLWAWSSGCSCPAPGLSVLCPLCCVAVPSPSAALFRCVGAGQPDSPAAAPHREKRGDRASLALVRGRCSFRDGRPRRRGVRLGTQPSARLRGHRPNSRPGAGEIMGWGSGSARTDSPDSHCGIRSCSTCMWLGPSRRRSSS